ncbi:hypothetical protein [Martelella alba]|uniref:Uncharacterized protein n=1 Tax=Martelella alba TaxID=2590451 RepID=A0ABY2SKG7_9HYPH|nr:hypothetical protein [Martelella alba]TKI04693.1 hypothetical protein FCN80_17175 [Martelella alba]
MPVFPQSRITGDPHNPMGCRAMAFGRRLCLAKRHQLRHIRAQGRALHALAQDLQSERNLAASAAAPLKPPRNVWQRFLYYLTAWHSLGVDAASRAAPSRRPLPLGEYRPVIDSFLSPYSLEHVWSSHRARGGKRTPRDAALSPPDMNEDWKTNIVWLLNHQGGANISATQWDDTQLAEGILLALEAKPALATDIARLSLGGSRLYGERKGEPLTAAQQKGLIGRLLCQLLFQAQSIELRIAELFAAKRHITQRELARWVDTWPNEHVNGKIKNMWRKHYEKWEIPVLYLSNRGGPCRPIKNASAPIENIDVDKLWVGSLTWTLLQFGARYIALEQPEKLGAVALNDVMAYGLNLVQLFIQGKILAGIESLFYLGLIIYYLRAKPVFTLAEINDPQLLKNMIAEFNTELKIRYSTAHTLYDCFVEYEEDFHNSRWYSREDTAKALLQRFCGNISAPLAGENAISRGYPYSFTHDPVQSFLHSPQGKHCGANKMALPDLDLTYRQNVETFANTIRKLDVALLQVAFTASDFDDDNLQSKDIALLHAARIEIVRLRLVQIRQPKEMFFSNAPVYYMGKADTVFLRVNDHSSEHIYVLRTSKEGYLVKRVDIHDRNLTTLAPFMESWPTIDVATLHQLVIESPSELAITKHHDDALASFLQNFAELHHRYYVQKIYARGYAGPDTSPWQIPHTIADYVIPFFGCINALLENDKTALFVSCLSDAAFVGIPIGFAGVKAGLTLFRQGTINLAKAVVNVSWKASEDKIFKKPFPSSSQIAGGIYTSRDQAVQLLNVVGKEFLMACDPGFVPLHAMGVVGNGVYRAMVGRALLASGSLIPSLKKIAEEIPKFMLDMDLLNFTVSYGYARTEMNPLTVNIKGITFPIFTLNNQSLVAVETGETTFDGIPVYAQVDMLSLTGLYNKFLCVYHNDGLCVFTAFRRPRFRAVLGSTVYESQTGDSVWHFTTRTPIYMMTIYPFNQLIYRDKFWIVLDINGQRWGFDHRTSTLKIINNADEWREAHHWQRELISVIESSIEPHSFRLRLTAFRRRKKRSDTANHYLHWKRLITSYILPAPEGEQHPVALYDNFSLRVRVGDDYYRLSPQSHSSRFLLIHPDQAHFPAYRLAYTVGNDGFVLVAPVESLNAHRLGELLRHKLAFEAGSVEHDFPHVLLPPLFCGAFRYGDRLYLKSGDRYVTLVPVDDIYYTLIIGDEQQTEWMVRYELFTGGFELVGLEDSFQISRPPAGTSWFERLAQRIFSYRDFPTLKALCRYADKSAKQYIQEPAMVSRLRQAALLLRLDEDRRKEALLASSVHLRTFSLDSAGGYLWSSGFPVLALWARAEYTIAACLARQAGQRHWTCREVARLHNCQWRIPSPMIITLGYRQTLFILNSTHHTLSEEFDNDYQIRITSTELRAIPVRQEKAWRRWLPHQLHSQPTTVSKVDLSGHSHPIIWIDNALILWAQTPDGHKTRLNPSADSPSRVADRIVVSPDGRIIVLIYRPAPSQQRALFYRLPSMGLSVGQGNISAYDDQLISYDRHFENAWWVTNAGQLLAPPKDNWPDGARTASAGLHRADYQPNFVSLDQRYLGYTKRGQGMWDAEILLFDLGSGATKRLIRSLPPQTLGHGMGYLTSVAFSALNIMAATGFSDGYIEIFRIDSSIAGPVAASLGYLHLPISSMHFEDFTNPKPMQMAIKFDNAFNRLIVFHDQGVFSNHKPGNGSYAVSEMVFDLPDPPIWDEIPGENDD